jgi:hypothetical protein
MTRMDEIKDKIKSYLQVKHNLDAPSCYAICKDLSDDYWDEWRNTQEAEEASMEDFSEFETTPHISNPQVVQEIRQQQDNPSIPNLRNTTGTIQVI